MGKTRTPEEERRAREREQYGLISYKNFVATHGETFRLLGPESKEAQTPEAALDAPAFVADVDKGALKRGYYEGSKNAVVFYEPKDDGVSITIPKNRWQKDFASVCKLTLDLIEASGKDTLKLTYKDSNAVDLKQLAIAMDQAEARGMALNFRSKPGEQPTAIEERLQYYVQKGGKDKLMAEEFWRRYNEINANASAKKIEKRIKSSVTNYQTEIGKEEKLATKYPAPGHADDDARKTALVTDVYTAAGVNAGTATEKLTVVVKQAEELNLRLSQLERAASSLNDIHNIVNNDINDPLMTYDGLSRLQTTYNNGAAAREALIQEIEKEKADLILRSQAWTTAANAIRGGLAPADVTRLDESVKKLSDYTARLADGKIPPAATFRTNDQDAGTSIDNAVANATARMRP